MRGRRAQAGFLLAEVAVGYIIVSLAIVSLMTVLILTVKANYASEATLVAAGLAQELMAEIRLRKWDQNRPDARPAHPSLTYSTIGIDAGESSTDKTTFSDIDDFNGWAEMPPQDPAGRPLNQFGVYRRTVTVQYVDSSLNVSAAATDYKLVRACSSRANVTRVCLDWLATNQ